MVDRVNIGKQIHTFQDHLGAIEKCIMIYNETHIIFIFLNKLSPSWTSFASAFRYKIDYLDLKGHYNTIRIEERNVSIP